MSFWKRNNPTKPTADPFERVVKVRGGGRTLADLPRAGLDGRAGLADVGRGWNPRGLNRYYQPSSGAGGLYDSDGYNRAGFYRWIRDSVPIISTGIWTWVRLCATAVDRLVTGSEAECERARQRIVTLDSRLLESPYGRGSGLTKLIEGMYLELFTVGRFTGTAVLSDDGKRVDHFRYINPHIVQWEHTGTGWTPYYEDGDKKEVCFDPELFFYAVLGVDLTNPAGVEPLACIPFVVEVEQLLLEDMARSSHNAGTPRLQVKIGRPERLNWESDKDYAERVNRYFNDTASQFSALEPDENVFTWDDVEVTVVGGSGGGSTWRFDREQVVEDVITGLKLFPWVLGRTHKTTQNWVQSQFDLLMQMVSAHQKNGVDIADWLVNLDLRLGGIKAEVRHHFEPHPDPFRQERAVAEKTEMENIHFKVVNGYISKEEGGGMMLKVKS